MNSEQQHTKALLGNNNLKIKGLGCFSISIKITLLFSIPCSITISMFWLVGEIFILQSFCLDHLQGFCFLFSAVSNGFKHQRIELSVFWFTGLPVRSTSSFSSLNSFFFSVGRLLRSTLSWWACAEGRVCEVRGCDETVRRCCPAAGSLHRCCYCWWWWQCSWCQP